ncbi:MULTISPECIES: hypothetical protein [Chitinibacteraceae]|nr:MULTISPECIES: hypothetical protein [Chitinibacteraceae]
MSEHIYFAESGLPKLRPDYAAAHTISVVQRLVLPSNHPTAVKE